MMVVDGSAGCYVWPEDRVLIRRSQHPVMFVRLSDHEFDHLVWCERRLEELGEDVSYLTPVWYLGSFGIGNRMLNIQGIADLK